MICTAHKIMFDHSSRTRWDGHVAYMGDKRNAQSFGVRKRPREKSRRDRGEF